MSIPSRSVIFVEDDDDLRSATAQSLELAGMEVQAFSSAAKALAAITADFPGVVVSDIRMPQMDGRKLFAHIRAIDPDLPVILVTGHADVPQAVDAMHDGAYDFLAKPFTSERLIRTVLNALEKRQLVMENRNLRTFADEAQLSWPLIGRSPAITDLRRILRQVAEADVDALIEGETGVGKELAARALHAWGPRSRQPFVVVGCAVLPATLSESELFGHELGAFPGAIRKRVGRIEHAHRGSLFLDEIEAIAPEAQAKLLRFLEEREIAPLGTNETRAVDVRVIATTRLDPARPDTMRPDLFHRLNVVKIKVPTLRERREDIPMLFAHFADRAAARFGREPPALTDGVRRRLAEHDWPGNVRELAHFSERVVLNLEPSHPAAETGAPRLGLRERVEQYEADVMCEALASNDGDIRKTLEDLGIPRKTLYDKIQRHGIDLSRYRQSKG